MDRYAYLVLVFTVATILAFSVALSFPIRGCSSRVLSQGHASPDCILTGKGVAGSFPIFPPFSNRTQRVR